LDFGLSIHTKETQEPLFTGSLRYASRNNHNGKIYTRIDDLESWIYIVIYFMKGALPWQNTMNSMTQSNIHKLQKEIGIHKSTIPVDDLCKGCPEWIHTVTKSILHPNATPEYSQYIHEMKKRMKELGTKFDYEYDWTSLPKRVFLR